MLPIAATDRLELRVLQLEDALPLAPLLADPIPWINAKIAQQRERGYSPWAVTYRASTGVVGFCGLFVRPGRGITLGYAIIPNERGNGLATEAAAAALAWAEARNLDVHASIRPPNPASERVLAKIGMQLCERQYDADGERLVYRRAPDSRPIP